MPSRIKNRLSWYSFIGMFAFLLGGCVVGTGQDPDKKCTTNKDCTEFQICLAQHCLPAPSELINQIEKSQEKIKYLDQKHPQGHAINVYVT